VHKSGGRFVILHEAASFESFEEPGGRKTQPAPSDQRILRSMKLRLRSSSPLKLLVVVSAVSLLTVSGLFANYGAFAYSTGSGSYGAYGLSWNWRTANGAIASAASTASYYNGGYLNGYQYAWWGHTGFEAGARGFNWDGSYVNFGWARGWRTRNGAVNYAIGRLGYNNYSLGYASGYNR
jgi:hypothetical protein